MRRHPHPNHKQKFVYMLVKIISEIIFKASKNKQKENIQIFLILIKLLMPIYHYKRLGLNNITRSKY